MRRGIISSCQSAATSEIVKRCCSSICKQRYSKYSNLYLYLYLWKQHLAGGRIPTTVLDVCVELRVYSYGLFFVNIHFQLWYSYTKV